MHVPILKAAPGAPEGPFLRDVSRVCEDGGKRASCRLPIVEMDTRR